MIINAKYKGTCTECNQPINIGDKINWSREKGAKHTSCSTAPEQKPTYIIVDGPEPNFDEVQGLEYPEWCIALYDADDSELKVYWVSDYESAIDEGERLGQSFGIEVINEATPAF